jgi:hypothetical protein
VSTDADALFKGLLRDLRPLFKENGFRASGQNFTLESAECWAIINFQKSRWSNIGEKTFYINVAIAPKRVIEFQREDPNKSPAYYGCEWRWRAEQFGPDHDIKQWTMKDEASAKDVLTYLQGLLGRHVIPGVKAYMSEDSLIEKTGAKPGYPQGKAVSVLLAANNRLEELASMVGYLVEHYGSGTVVEGVRTHLEQLRNQYPEQMRVLER